MIKLIKLVAFIDSPAKGSGAVIKNLKGFETFNIGLAAKLLLMLSVKFDKLLVDNSKWHIFRAFQILTGLSFKKFTENVFEAFFRPYISQYKSFQNII